MRKETFGKGLSALLIGAESFFGGAGCNSPQSNYQGNNQQQREYDAGDAGRDALQFLGSIAGINPNLTQAQRDFGNITAGLIRDEKRNEAIGDSGTTVNVYNGQNGQTQEQLQGRPQSQVLDWSRMSSEGIMNYLYRNRISTTFVCNRVIDINNNGLIGPEDYIGIKSNFRENEEITVGSLNFGQAGNTLQLMIITSSGREYLFSPFSIMSNTNVHRRLLRPNEIEKGRSTLVTYLNGRFSEKIEFE